MKRFLKWLENFVTGGPIRRIEYTYQVVQRDPCRLRLHEWRSSPDLAIQARKLLSDPIMRTMLDVVDTEHPANMVLSDSTTIENRAVWQSRCEGYTMALANFESMGIYQKPKQELEATFEPPETEQ